MQYLDLIGTYSFSTKVPGNERFLLYKYLYSGVWSRQVQALRKNRLLSLSPPPHSNPEETRHQGGRRGFLRIIELVRRSKRRLVGAGCRTWPSSCRGTSRWTASGSSGFATSPWRTSWGLSRCPLILCLIIRGGMFQKSFINKLKSDQTLSLKQGERLKLTQKYFQQLRDLVSYCLFVIITDIPTSS